MTNHDRRIARLEIERVAGDMPLGVLFIPTEVEPGEVNAWLAARSRSTTGPGVVVIPKKGSRG